MIRDGWHKASGYRVYVENGLVVMGISDGRTVYPFRWSRNYHIWGRVNITLAAFNAGMRRGTITLM